MMAQYFVWHMDEGVLGGYATKKKAMHAYSAARCSRIEGGNWQTVPMFQDSARVRTVVIGTRKSLKAIGIEIPQRILLKPVW